MNWQRIVNVSEYVWIGSGSTSGDPIFCRDWIWNPSGTCLKKLRGSPVLSYRNTVAMCLRLSQSSRRQTYNHNTARRCLASLRMESATCRCRSNDSSPWESVPICCSFTICHRRLQILRFSPTVGNRSASVGGSRWSVWTMLYVRLLYGAKTPWNLSFFQAEILVNSWRDDTFYIMDVPRLHNFIDVYPNCLFWKRFLIYFNHFSFPSGRW
jgi:hypothetical protein